MNGIYKPDIGLKSEQDNKVQIYFGDNREHLRSLLNFQKPSINRFENEDSYENLLGTDDWIRLSFVDNKLDEIEILVGEITVDNIKVAVDEELDKAIEEFKSNGFKIKEGDMSYIIPELKLDIGDREKNGGEENRVAWLFMTRDLEYLMKE